MAILPESAYKIKYLKCSCETDFPDEHVKKSRIFRQLSEREIFTQRIQKE